MVFCIGEWGVVFAWKVGTVRCAVPVRPTAGRNAAESPLARSGRQAAHDTEPGGGRLASTADAPAGRPCLRRTVPPARNHLTH